MFAFWGFPFFMVLPDIFGYDNQPASFHLFKRYLLVAVKSARPGFHARVYDTIEHSLMKLILCRTTVLTSTIYVIQLQQMKICAIVVS
jgi:hypothetical protein